MSSPRSMAEAASPSRRPGLPGLPAWSLVLIVALSLLFVLWPQLDLAISGRFADAAGFPLRLDPTIAVFNNGLLIVSRWLSGLLLLATILAFTVRRWSRLHALRRPLLFLVVAAALGPGLLVNVVLKEGSGRARPVTVQEFGGSKQFTPAYVIADQCADNCSFVSGHASIAAMPMAGWFVARSRRARRGWLLGGLAFALVAAVFRVIVGAHFASDALLAIAFTWVVIALCAAVILRPARDGDAGPTPAAEPPAR